MDRWVVWLVGQLQRKREEKKGEESEKPRGSTTNTTIDIIKWPKREREREQLGEFKTVPFHPCTERREKQIN